MSKISNQIFEPKSGKVFFQTNGTNLVPTIVPAHENADPNNPDDFISINEYMMKMIETNPLPWHL
jgi:hypothetical protein